MYKCPKYYIGQTGRSFKIRYTEHIKALTKPLIKSNFEEHIFNTHHTPSNKNSYPEVYTNLNAPNPTSIKQVDLPKIRYIEHIKALTQPLTKSNFAEHIFNTNHSCINIETNS